jgi:hypothetical protein
MGVPLSRVLVFEMVIICHYPICNKTRLISTLPELVLLSSSHPDESTFDRVSQFENLINQIQ